MNTRFFRLSTPAAAVLLCSCGALAESVDIHSSWSAADTASIPAHVHLIDFIGSGSRSYDYDAVSAVGELPSYQDSAAAGGGSSLLHASAVYVDEGSSISFRVRDGVNASISSNVMMVPETGSNANARYIDVVQVRSSGSLTIESGGSNVFALSKPASSSSGRAVSQSLIPGAVYGAISNIGSRLSITGASNFIGMPEGQDASATVVSGFAVGLYSLEDSTLSLTASSGSNTVRLAAEFGRNSYGLEVADASLFMTAAEENRVTVTGDAAYAFGAFSASSDAVIRLEAAGNRIEADNTRLSAAIRAYSRNGTVALEAGSGGNTLISAGAQAKDIFASLSSSVSLSAEDGGSNVLLYEARSLDGTWSSGGIDVTTESTVTLTAEGGGDNVIRSLGGAGPYNDAIRTRGSSKVYLTSDEGSNIIDLDIDLSSAASESVAGIREDAVLALGAGTVEFSAVSNLISVTYSNAPSGSEPDAAGLVSREGSRIALHALNDNAVTSAGRGLAAEGGTIELSAEGGTNRIAAKSAAADSSSASGTAASVTISGRTVLSGEPALRSTAAGGIESTVALRYAGSSAVTGAIAASGSGAAVTVAPYTEQGRIAIAGDVSTSDGGAVSIALTSGSTLTGTARTAAHGSFAEASPGTIALSADAGSLWSMTDSSTVTALSGSGGTVDFARAGTSLAAGSVSGEHTYRMTLRTDGSGDMLYAAEGTADRQTLYVKNAAELAAAMQPGDAVRFATVKSAQGGFADGSTAAEESSGVYLAKLVVQYRDAASDPLNTDEINAAYNEGEGKPGSEAVQALYGGSGSSNVYLTLEQTEIPTDAALEAEKAEEIRWRIATGIDTYVKRKGQTAAFDADNGLWVRLLGQDADVKHAASLHAAGIELGASHVSELTDTLKRKEGIAVGYKRARGSWDGISGSWHADDVAVTLYDTAEYRSAGAKSAEDYWYRDSYLRMQNLHMHGTAADRYDGEKHSVGFPTTVFNLSTELGRSVPLTPTLTLIPQAQLQASWLAGWSGNEDGIRVSRSGEWSLIGRAGFDAVKSFAGGTGKLRLKASVLHEFADGGDLSASASGRTWRADIAGTGTWYTAGAGLSCRVGEGKSVYIDAERAMGNGWRDAYELHAGFSWRF